jgi:outer membrane protein
MKKIIFILMLVCLLSFARAAVFAEGEGRIGLVDLSKAFDEYQKTKDFDKSLDTKGEAKQKEREVLVKEIRKMRDEIELLNEASKEAKEKDIESKIRFLQEFDQEVKAELTKDRDDMVRDILKEMNDVIQQYGDREGYSVILNDRVLLYGDKALDLTDKIIKNLNDNYKR